MVKVVGEKSSDGMLKSSIKRMDDVVHNMVFKRETFRTLVTLIRCLNVDEFQVKSVKKKGQPAKIVAAAVDVAHIFMGEFRVRMSHVGIKSKSFKDLDPLIISMQTARIVSVQAVKDTIISLATRRINITDYDVETLFKIVKGGSDREIEIRDKWSYSDAHLMTWPRQPKLEMMDQWTFSVGDLLPLSRRNRFISGKDTLSFSRDGNDLVLKYGHPAEVKFVVSSERKRLDKDSEFDHVQLDVEFFNSIITAIRNSDKNAIIKLSLGTEFPMRLQGLIHDVEFDFYLAPRVERD